MFVNSVRMIEVIFAIVTKLILEHFRVDVFPKQSMIRGSGNKKVPQAPDEFSSNTACVTPQNPWNMILV